MRRRQDKKPGEPMAVDLLVLDESMGPEAATRPVTSFGGLPAVPPGTAGTWPRCGDLCDTPMLYTGKRTASS
ncbi:hypothetical protein ACIRNU_09555 [Streptomyces rochei]|uniref:hypothetical protein n=1 Tax=Streptomyces rochei TaxID=1928 RepID=UPI00380E1A02